MGVPGPMTLSPVSIQDAYAPTGICFGCGASGHGLRLKSFPQPDGTVVCRFTPSPEHQAFPGVLNGGIIGTVLDCHMNNAAAWFLMQRDREERLPSTVTAEFTVKLKRPTPFPAETMTTARIVESEGDRVVVEAEMVTAGKVTATGRGVFIRVHEGHPAYQRW
ncbi:MAG TPA: PaaI family thioesterase [Candidatus Thermoplasmatota archaeon]|nr:PaaI family thioesterase [Candidatus Thermoplasmatota archaeon]